MNCFMGCSMFAKKIYVVVLKYFGLKFYVWQDVKTDTAADKLFQKISLDIQVLKEYIQNIGLSLHRKDGPEVAGVQSTVRTLVSIQKYIKIMFTKDVDLAASFAADTASLAMTDTENKKLDRLDKERLKKKGVQAEGGGPPKKFMTNQEKRFVQRYKCWNYGHYAQDWGCPKNRPGAEGAPMDQRLPGQLQIQHHPRGEGWSH